MADVRSLLRNELASRGSSAQSGSAGPRVTKKRKIEGTDLSIQSKHKKSRPTTPAHISTLGEGDDNETESVLSNQGPEDVAEEDSLQGEETGGEIDQQDANSPNERKIPIISASSQIPAPAQTINEDEWAAFERDVVAPTRIPQAPAAAVAATISAAPVTADELAAQQQKQKEEEARIQEEDAEGEKEDAARHLEEEFEEMEQLEERVKRLKAKREELRSQNLAESNGTTVDAQENTQQDDDESEDDEDDADWDDWRFR